MLCPVSNHHYKTRKEKRNNENYHCCGKTNKGKTDTQKEKKKFTHQAFNDQQVPVFFMEVTNQPEHTKKQEIKKVAEKINEAVSLIRHGGASVVLQVIFRMMHPDVMTVIGFRCLSKEWPNHPWKIVIE